MTIYTRKTIDSIRAKSFAAYIRSGRTADDLADFCLMLFGSLLLMYRTDQITEEEAAQQLELFVRYISEYLR